MKHLLITTIAAVLLATTVYGGENPIPRGSDWHYLDDGSDQGTAWRGVEFDDSAWSSGSAQLGYGDGDEATVVSFGPNSANKYVTTYFRKAFELGELERPMVLRILRDDGAAVYINGVEVFRSNMPAGEVGYQTLAAGVADGAQESTEFLTAAVPPEVFRVGLNLVAVEVHQVSRMSSDISFDLELGGDGGDPGDGAPFVVLLEPSTGQTFLAPAEILIRAGAEDEEGPVSLVEFFAGDDKIGEATSAPFVVTWGGVGAGEYTLRAVATGSGGLTATSAGVEIVVQLEPNPGMVTNLFVLPGAVWRYHDLGVDLGDDWVEVGFDDREWSAGPAQLGYGDGDELTELSFGGDSSNKHPTYYFRHAFELNDPASFTHLRVNLLRDDGAVVYLNGVEIVRDNMPAGPIGYNTLATGTVGGGLERTEFVSFDADASPLREGRNVVAAEIHQVRGSSSDVSFDLGLAGVGPGASGNRPPTVRLVSPPDGAVYDPPAEIVLGANASDSDGRVVRVEFLSGEDVIVVIEGDDDNGSFTRTWEGVGPGEYAMRVRATDDEGATSVSLPVEVRVVPFSDLPTVSIRMREGVAEEDEREEGSFLVMRDRTADEPLVVYYSIGGTAENGVDYNGENGQPLKGQVIIEPGARSVVIDVVPVDDEVAEGTETIILRLVTGPPESGGYSIEPSLVEAEVEIRDNDELLPPVVVINYPEDDVTFHVPDQILFACDASSLVDGHRVESVEVYEGERWLGAAIFHPFFPLGQWLFHWNDAVAGDFVITARATDDRGLVGVSEPLRLSVVESNVVVCPVEMEWEFIKGEERSDTLKRVVEMPDGGYIAGGTSYSRERGLDFWALRVDAEGSLVWEGRYGGASTEEMFELQLTSDGGVILGGASSSAPDPAQGKSSPHYGDFDFWILKLDGNGEVVWDRSYGGADLDVIFGLEELADGGFILGGASKSGPSGTKTSAGYGLYDLWLVRIDADGNQVWDRTFGGTERESRGRARATSDGGFVICGDSESGISGNKTTPNYGEHDGWIVKVDGAGNKLWDQTLGGDEHEWLGAVVEVDDGGIFTVGHSHSGATGNKERESFGSTDGWAVMLNADGSKRWELAIGGTSSDLLTSVAVTPDGGFLLGGHSRSSINGNKTSPRISADDLWLVRLDRDGGKLWDRAFTGGSLWDFGLMSDGQIVVVGNTWSGETQSDGWMVKLAPAETDCDSDGDGVPDVRDDCPGTLAGAVVDFHGCSIEQLCPCDGEWKDHRQYVDCVLTTAWDFYRRGLITSVGRQEVIWEAAGSDCGGRGQLELLTQPQTEAELLRDGLLLILTGDIDGMTCVLECSSDLKKWHVLDTVSLEASPQVYVDKSAEQCPHGCLQPMRFYRVKLVE